MLPLITIRYALGQGAAASAIDIEEYVQHGVSGGNLPSMRVLQHDIQRRNKSRCMEEEPIGNSEWTHLIIDGKIEELVVVMDLRLSILKCIFCRGYCCYFHLFDSESIQLLRVKVFRRKYILHRINLMVF